MVFNGRSYKQFYFKSFDDLLSDIEKEWPVLRHCNYTLFLKTKDLGPISDLTKLKACPEENQIVVKKDLTTFSKVSKERKKERKKERNTERNRQAEIEREREREREEFRDVRYKHGERKNKQRN